MSDNEPISQRLEGSDIQISEQGILNAISVFEGAFFRLDDNALSAIATAVTNPFVQAAKKIVDKIDSSRPYHGNGHTYMMIVASIGFAERLLANQNGESKKEGILGLIGVAAAVHDTGYHNGVAANHEERSCGLLDQMNRDTNNQYDEDEIEFMKALIMSTKMDFATMSTSETIYANQILELASIFVVADLVHYLCEDRFYLDSQVKLKRELNIESGSEQELRFHIEDLLMIAGIAEKLGRVGRMVFNDQEINMVIQRLEHKRKAVIDYLNAVAEARQTNFNLLVENAICGSQECMNRAKEVMWVNFQKRFNNRPDTPLQ